MKKFHLFFMKGMLYCLITITHMDVPHPASLASLFIWNPRSLELRDWLNLFGVFALYFLSGWLCLHLYLSYDTLPALIWAPVGIGFAAVLFGGYRMWLPIFLAQFLVVLVIAPSAYAFAALTAAAYALQAVLALYAFERLDFRSAFADPRDVLIFGAVTLGVCTVEPLLVTLLLQLLQGPLPGGLLLNFGRNWGSNISSVLVLTPFAVIWREWQPDDLQHLRVGMLELFAAFAVLIAIDYFIFWTDYAAFFGISVIFFLPAILLWFTLRMHPRWMTLAILLTTVLAISGTLVGHAGSASLGSLLLTDEIYIALISGMFLLFVSIVEERRRMLTHLTVELEATSAADIAKTRFISILAHELRNPLAPLVSSLELMQLEPQTQESMEAIETAQVQTAMMQRLLDDLLDTARLSQDKLQLHKEMVDMRGVLEQSIASVHDFMGAQRHTLRTRMPDRPIMLDADPVRLKQIVINLLNNAAKYTPAGGMIDLSCRIEGDSAIIRVSDTGIGVPDELIEQIFEPFQQASRPKDEALGTGLGIGLFLTKQLVLMHGGTVEASSEGKDRGSTFTVRLPMPQQVSLSYAAHPKSAPDSGKRFLLVDDNVAYTKAMQKLLAHHGHIAQTVHSGEEALKVIPSFKPNVIVLDIGMPGMNGYATARAIRAQGWNGTIIALSGYGQESDRQQSKDAGFDHHLVKPASVGDILALFA